MHTSSYWIGHFKENAKKLRINWNTEPKLTAHELANILPSLQAWHSFLLCNIVPGMVSPPPLVKAGGNSFSLYMRRMDLKYKKTLHTITSSLIMQMT
ncbi:MAG: hypothetical protein ABIN91_01835 [Mucilaginibacter sp.]|uniref:hypothetical protein n=1 Tax=Mucilaginibacter sp. TaxID=1882438 RepID=UPI0032640F73